MKDQKDKEPRTNPTPKHIALQKRVLELETNTGKRHRAAALEEWTIMQKAEDAKAARAQIDLEKIEAIIKFQTSSIVKHREHEQWLFGQRRLAEHTTWLQGEYASLLFDRCRDRYKSFGPLDRQGFLLGS